MASAVAAALALAQNVQAQGITGTFSIIGEVTLNASTAGSASTATSWIAPYIFASSGTFSNTAQAGLAVTFNGSSWSFSSGAQPDFLTVGGFLFNLISSSVSSQGGTQSAGWVNVTGTGTIGGNGYTTTQATWSFNCQDPMIGHNPDQWAFSATVTAVPAPEPSAVALMSAALGLVLVCRRLGSWRRGNL